MPASVPPHDPVYHLIDAPVPSVPPETLSVEVPPLQIVGDDADALVGATEAVLTVTTVDALPPGLPHGAGPDTDTQ